MTSAGSGSHWHGVIDIGSNSVRLVIYDVSGHALLPHYNEKVMARLGEGLAETGKLSVDGKKRALKALGRYHAILDGLNVKRVRAVATAAVRAARDGDKFIKQVKSMTGLEVEVISGQDEARFSALGVSGGIHKATGLVGDLGGSSLEFSRVENGVVQDGESLMLGPLSMNLEGQERQEAVREALSGSRLLPESGGRFYMVGGAWRALAKLHMIVTEYPLRQLHSYLLDEHAILAIDEAVSRTDPVGLQRLAKASQRRQDVLPYAHLVLSETFKVGGFTDAMVSSYGLREGVILEGLEQEGSDPLLEGIALSVRLQDQRRAFGEALYEWVRPVVQPHADLFGERDLDMRLVAGACLFADSGARFHPDTRAELAYARALNGLYSNVTHAERAFIALSVGHRYARQFRPPSRGEALLDRRQTKLAKRLGAAMRLGAVYSGRSADILGNSELIREDSCITLAVPSERRALVSMTVERRLKTLAMSMDLATNVVFT